MLLSVAGRGTPGLRSGPANPPPLRTSRTPARQPLHLAGVDCWDSSLLLIVGTPGTPARAPFPLSPPPRTNLVVSLHTPVPLSSRSGPAALSLWWIVGCLCSRSGISAHTPGPPSSALSTNKNCPTSVWPKGHSSTDAEALVFFFPPPSEFFFPPPSDLMFGRRSTYAEVLRSRTHRSPYTSTLRGIGRPRTPPKTTPADKLPALPRTLRPGP